MTELKVKEHWKILQGYDKQYRISTEGAVEVLTRKGPTNTFLYKRLKPHRKVGGTGLYIHLWKNGKRLDKSLVRLVYETFVGPLPKNVACYHINGFQNDNRLVNITTLSNKQLGHLTAHMSRRRGVVKLDRQGNVVEVFRSTREAAKADFTNKQSIILRCNKKLSIDPYELTGFDYRYDDTYWD